MDRSVGSHLPVPSWCACVCVHGVGPPEQQLDQSIVVDGGLQEYLDLSGLEGGRGKTVKEPAKERGKRSSVS